METRTIERSDLEMSRANTQIELDIYILYIYIYMQFAVYFIEGVVVVRREIRALKSRIGAFDLKIAKQVRHLRRSHLNVN